MRQITYPDGRVVEYDYGQGTTGQPYDADRINYALGRVCRIGETVGQQSQVHGEYAYLGDGTIVSEFHPDVAAGLLLTLSGGITGSLAVGDYVYELPSDGQTLEDGRGVIVGKSDGKIWIQATEQKLLVTLF